MVGDTTDQDVDVAPGRLNEAATIVSWEPEPAGVGLTVTYELNSQAHSAVTLVGELDSLVLGQTRDAF